MKSAVHAILSKEEILARLRTHKQELQKKYPIAGLALYGSYSRGDQTAESDIDIMIDLKEPMGWDIFPDKKIDMATKGGLLNSRYRPYIEEDLIYV